MAMAVTASYEQIVIGHVREAHVHALGVRQPGERLLGAQEGLSREVELGVVVAVGGRPRDDAAPTG